MHNHDVGIHHNNIMYCTLFSFWALSYRVIHYYNYYYYILSSRYCNYYVYNILIQCTYRVTLYICLKLLLLLFVFGLLKLKLKLSTRTNGVVTISVFAPLHQILKIYNLLLKSLLWSFWWTQYLSIGSTCISHNSYRKIENDLLFESCT